MKLFFITVFVFACMSTMAQKKANFSSQNYAGLLEGGDGSKFQLQTINGIEYRRWFIGLGTGIDWYYLRSIPVFLSLNKNFFKSGKRNFFLALNSGVNFPWKMDNYQNKWGYDIAETSKGLFWEGGLGYKIGIGKRNDALLMQIGYSYKHLVEKARSGNIIIFDIPELNATERFDYKLRRVALKIGWNF